MMEFMGIGVFLFIVWFATIALTAASFGFWIWMLIECVTKEPNEGNDKLIWILVIIFANAVGAAVYYFVRRPERIRLYGQ